jgi:hypothetical protein
MKYFTLPSLAFYIFCLVLASCKSKALPTEQFVLTKLNEEIKPPLTYKDLKKIDDKSSNQMGEDVYWMKYQIKLAAGSDLHVFTKRGFVGMDTFYVADSDTSFLNKIAHDIQATNNYNKQFGEFRTSYKEIKAIKKGEMIKEEIGGINLRKTDSGWVRMK